MGELAEVRKVAMWLRLEGNPGLLGPKGTELLPCRLQPGLEAVAAGKQERSGVFLTAVFQVIFNR